MNTITALLLAAATTGGGFFSQPDVGGKRFLRRHVVRSGEAPPGGPIDMNAMRAGATGMPGRRFQSVRSQVFFSDPAGMKIGWQTTASTGEKVYLADQLSVPARYNFLQGYIYRLKITGISSRPGLVLYPTIEVAPSTPSTDAFLTHNPIPVQFTEEDFDQVTAGNFVTKVIYLPDPKYQELATQLVDTIISTRLEPGIDPILEADRRGTILLIMRLGAIDLETPGGGPVMPGRPGAGGATPAPAVNGAPTTVVPVAPQPPMTESVPVDEAAPVSTPLAPQPAAPPTNPTVENPAAAPADAAAPAQEAKPTPPAEDEKAAPPADAPK
jgi:hypothetical protein